MFGVLDALALHSKIVNYHAENDRVPHVAVWAMGEFPFVVAVLSESLLEYLVGQDACFINSLHTHIYFEIDILVVDNVAHVVFFDDLIW